MKQVNKIIWGLIFIIVGIIVGTNALNITNINLFFSGWWTLLIIIPSILGLFKKEGVLGSFIGLVIGLTLLLGIRDVIDFNIISSLILPFILITIGFYIIFNNVINNKVSEKIKSIGINGLENITATFSEQKIKKDNEKFSGANLDVVFGGISLDLEKATFDKETIIKTSAIFGGIKIKVPDNVNIKLKSTSIFGGLSNKITNKKDDKKIIYIEAFCLFGGLEIE